MTAPGENKIVGGDVVAVDPFGVAKVERISFAVVAHVKTLGERGDCATVFVELRQAVNAIGDDFKRHEIGRLSGVERDDVRAEHDFQFVAVGRVVAACGCEHRQHEQHHQQNFFQCDRLRQNHFNCKKYK